MNPRITNSPERRAASFGRGSRGLLLAVALAGACVHAPSATRLDASVADLAIRNVTVIDGTGAAPMPDRTVLVTDGRIVALLDHEGTGTAEREIDGSGRFLIPGLIDGHCHPSIAGAEASAPLAFEAIFEPMVRFGVTSAVVYGGSRGSYASMADMARKSAAGEWNAPRIFHTSPIVTIEGAHPIKTYTSDAWVEGATILIPRSLADIDRIVADAAQRDVLGIKIIVEDGPTPPFIEPMPAAWVERFVEQGDAHDLPIYAHVSNMDAVRTCVAAGVHALVHLWGVDVDWDVDAPTIDAMVEREISWVTTLTLGNGMAYAPQHPERLERADLRAVFPPAVLDGLRSLGSADEARARLERWYGDPDLPQKAFFARDVGTIAAADRRGVNIVLGTDLGNDHVLPGFSLHEEMELLQAGGIPPLDILRMGTHNAARMLGRLDDLGTLEVGKLADMVLLTADPTADITHALAIERVFVGGEER